MSSFSISSSKPKTIRHPLHQHPEWEILYYLEGTGYLQTTTGSIKFSPGTIVIVPPKTIHASVSKDGFVNISICGDFGHVFMFDNIIAQQDNNDLNGKRLATLILDNRFSDTKYLSTLCNAYAHFLLTNVVYEKRINKEINNIIKEIEENYSEPHFDVTNLLNKSGYTEDYIRAEFKNVTTLTPIDFLTKTRIEHAKKMLEIYGSTLSVSQIALSCGFEDPIYFSRRFKQFTAISPSEYKKQTLI